MTCCLRCLFILVLCCLASAAQNRAQFPWWNSPVAQSEIGLTATQTTRIRQIVRSYRDRLFDARNNLQKAEAALDDLINDPDFSPESAKSVIDRVATARGNSNRVFLEMSAQLRAILSYEQWKTLVQRWDEVKGKKLTDALTTPQ